MLHSRSKLAYPDNNPNDMPSPPVFVEVFKNARFAQGGNAHFEGSISGNPRPNVTWTRKGKPMHRSEKYELKYDESSPVVSMTINNIGPGDEGEYSCVALNPYGEAICTVYISPEATMGGNRHVAKSKSGHRLHKSENYKQQSQSISMKSQHQQIYHQEQMQHQQKIESSMMNFSERQHNSNSSMLQQQTRQLSNEMNMMMTKEQHGYQQYGEQVHHHEQHRQKTQMFQQQHFQSQHSMMSQQTYNFQQSSSSEQHVSSKQLQEANNNDESEVIYLKHVAQQKQIQNKDYKSSSGGQIALPPAPQYGPPVIIKHLQNQTVNEGEKIHFEAKIEPAGDPSMEILWLFKGSPMEASSRINESFQFGYITLDILSLNLNDSGEYTCMVRNQSGSTYSTCQLEVMKPKVMYDTPDYSGSYTQHQEVLSVNRVKEETKISFEAPYFTQPLPSSLIEANEGDTLQLEGQIEPQGDSTMRIDWLHNGKSITAGARLSAVFNFGYVSLSISNLRPEDAGTYTCICQSLTGSAESSSIIKINAEDINDEKLSFEAEQQLQHEKFVWEKQMHASQQFLKEQEEIKNKAQNKPPLFKTALMDQLNIQESGFAHFEAQLEPMGDTTMSVEWLCDGRVIEASSRITTFFNFGYVALTIKQVAMHDMGKYTCRAVNSAGEATSSADLTVAQSHENWSADAQFHKTEEEEFLRSKFQHKEATLLSENVAEPEPKPIPKFLSQLKGTRLILEGQTAHFEARLEPLRDASLTLAWFLNGECLQASSRIKVYNDFGYIAIDIADTTSADAGTYTLVAKNLTGEVHSQIELSVDPRSKDVDVSTIHSKAVEETRKFEIRKEHQTNVGIYNETNTSINAKPVFSTPLIDPKPVLEGQNIHLEGRLEPINDPNMSVEWKLNGKPLTIGSRFRTYNDFGFVALDIVGVSETDAGTYTCLAKNCFGRAESKADVKVIIRADIVSETENESFMIRSEQQEQYKSASKTMQIDTRNTEVVDSPMHGPPEFVRSLKRTIETQEGLNVHLEARLGPIEDTTLKVEWMFNGMPLRTGHRFRPAFDFDYVALDLLSVYAEDSGDYTCIATNAAGRAISTTTLKVHASAGTDEHLETSGMQQFTHLEQQRHYVVTADGYNSMSYGSHDDEIDAEEKSQPMFTVHLRDAKLEEGFNVSFDAKITPIQDPTLKVEWFLNNDPIKQGSRYTESHDFGHISLFIAHVTSEDSGCYTCRVTNERGSATSTCNLVVKERERIERSTMHEAAMEQINYLEDSARFERRNDNDDINQQQPTFVTSLRDQNVVEGHSAHFESRIIPIGDPQLCVQWLKDGQPLEASNRISTLYDFGFVALDLKYTRLPGDVGTYTCRIFNNVGEAVSSAKLLIMSLQEDQANKYNSQQNLCLKSHEVAGHIYDRKNDEDDDDQITTAPFFVSQLYGKNNLIEGENLHLECQINPYPDTSLKVEWFFNGQPLPYGNRWRTLYDFGFAALDIIGVYPEDSGTYVVRATNILGSSESQINLQINARNSLLLETEHTEALQKIKYLESKHRRNVEEDLPTMEKPTFGHKMVDVFLDEGQPAHFESTLTPVNDSNMQVVWLCNGKPIQQGHRFRTTYDFGYVALDILYSYAEDSGVYTCVASNALGKAVADCSLKVQGMSGLLLDTMDRERLVQLQSLEQQQKILKAKGMFMSCAAEEEAKTQSASRQKPVFVKQLRLEQSEFNEQDRVRMECHVEPSNDPGLRIEWYRNGQSIQTGHRFHMTNHFGYNVLDILYVYPEDSGIYTCRAINEAGESVTECSINVRGCSNLQLDTQHPEGWEKLQYLESKRMVHHERHLQVEDVHIAAPKFITELMGLKNLEEGQSAHFEAQIEPINDPDLKMEFTLNGQPLMQGSRIHTLCDFGYIALDIQQLFQKSDAGTYECRIFNSLGEARSAINLQIEAKSILDMDSKQPRGLEMIQRFENRESSYRLERQTSTTTFQRPIFTQALHEINSNESETVYLEATLIPLGDPTLTIHWLHDGKVLEAGSRINMIHNFGLVALSISDLRENDAGIYECKATNLLGEAITTASLKVSTKASLLLDSDHPDGMKKIVALEDSKIARFSSNNSRNVNLQQYGKPVFRSPLVGTAEVREGGTIHLECAIYPENDPSMSVEWTKNGESLQKSSRFQATHDFGYVALDINSCRYEDSGMYTIKACNVSGVASSSFAIHVEKEDTVLREAIQPDSLKHIQEIEKQRELASTKTTSSLSNFAVTSPPRFIQQFNNVGKIEEGKTILVEAQLEPIGDPNLELFWQCNGNPLETGSRLQTTFEFGIVRLLISSIRLGDSGIYTCKAINSLGEDVSTTCIEVQQENAPFEASSNHEMKPQFNQKLENQKYITESQSCHFECKYSPINDPNLKIEWLKDNEPIKMGHRVRLFNNFGIAILDVIDCSVKDSGEYKCVARNNHGSSITISLMECRVSPESGLVMTSQVKESVREDTMKHIKMLETASIKFPEIGDDTTSSIAPHFIVPIKTLNGLCEGDSAHFEAKLEPVNDPKLIVEWQLNGKSLKNGSRIRTLNDFGFIILEISPVYPEDSGEYSCRAKNMIGEAVTSAFLECSSDVRVIMDSQLPRSMEGAISKIAKLEGLGKDNKIGMMDTELEADQPPKFLNQLKDQTMMENSLIHIESQLIPIHDPSLKVNWFHNDKQIGVGSRIRTINDFGFVILEIGNVVGYDSGKYTCIATNAYGEDSISCNIKVTDKHEIITDPQVPMRFQNGNESIKKLEERNYLQKFKNQEVSQMDFEIEKIAPQFTSKIQNMQCFEGQPAHFDCKLEPVGDGSMVVEWFHNGESIQIGSRIHTISDFGFVVLDIDWTFQRDEGTYTCRATNKYGTASTEAILSCRGKKDVNVDTQLPEGMSMERLKSLEQGYVHNVYDINDDGNESEKVPPKFLKNLENQVVAEGQPTHMECHIHPKTDNTLTIKWFHNDKEMQSGHRFRLTHEFGYVALDILYTYPEDRGEYVCKAISILGEATTKCELLCIESPSIQLENQVPKGMKKSECLVQMEATMKKYTQDMHLTEDDVYDSELHQPPRFVTKISSVTNLTEMQATKFECQLAPVGDPYMKVEWFFNGNPLPFKNRFTPIYDFGYCAMNFAWVYAEDSGEYLCRATNKYGSDSTKATIRLIGKPSIVYESQLPKGMASIEKIYQLECGWQRAPDGADEEEMERFAPCFVTKPEPQVVPDGGWARYCCRVTGYPKPRVMWLLNGQTVINGSKHKLLYDGMWHFDIPRCRDIDTGKVEVVARNQCGEAYTSTTLLVEPRQDDYRSVLRNNVKRDYINSKEYRKPEWVTRMEEIQKRLSEQQSAPKFISEVKDVRIKEGMKAKFEAHFVGKPTPKVIWLYKGEEIRINEDEAENEAIQIRIKDNKTVLTLYNCTIEMSGIYHCKLVNSMGTDTSRASLTVSKHGGGQAHKQKIAQEEKISKVEESSETMIDGGSVKRRKEQVTSSSVTKNTTLVESQIIYDQ